MTPADKRMLRWVVWPCVAWVVFAFVLLAAGVR